MYGWCQKKIESAVLIKHLEIPYDSGLMKIERAGKMFDGSV
jgi:hypothetical protein